MSEPEFEHLIIEKVSMESVTNTPRAKGESPRERARRERDEEISRAIDAVREMPDHLVLAITLGPGQKLSTMRAAVHRAVAAKEADDLVVSVRAGNRIFLARKAIPGGRGRTPLSRRAARQS